jgi:hypothetical protein
MDLSSFRPLASTCSMPSSSSVWAAETWSRSTSQQTQRLSNWASADIRYGFTQRRPGPISDRRCGYFSMGRNPRGPKPPANIAKLSGNAASAAHTGAAPACRRSGTPKVECGIPATGP